MGRLDHLKRTLPLLVAQPDLEIIVVDYSCPQQTGNWVRENFPTVKIVEVHGCSSFDLAKARNAGVSVSTSSWLCFIDADVIVSSVFSKVLHELLQPGEFLRHPRINRPGFNGFVVVSREDFDLVGGYDERCVDYGWEDSEFYENLIYRGKKEKFVPRDLFEPISHDDESRTKNCVEKDKRKSWKRNCDLPKRYK